MNIAPENKCTNLKIFLFIRCSKSTFENITKLSFDNLHRKTFENEKIGKATGTEAAAKLLR